MATSNSLAVLDKIKPLLSSNEPQLISSGFNIFLEANELIWDAYLQSSPECNIVYHCLSLGKHKLTPDILEKCWKACTRIYARGKKSIISPSMLQDIVSKYLKHIFYSLSKNTPQSLTHCVLGFMSSAVLYDSHHASLILSHCNLSHNIYHYMYSHKSAVRPTIIKFILSFFMTDDYQLIRSVLEHRSVFNKIFRYIKHDTLQLSYLVVALLAKHVFSVEISKKLKISLFSPSSLVHLLHLLDHEEQISLEADPVTFHLRTQGITDVEIPFCDYVQSFIRVLCQSGRIGILYAPKTEMIQEYKYNNSSILHFLKAIPYQLRVGEKVEGLIIELLHFSPDIVYDYFSDEWFRTGPKIEYEWVKALEFLTKFYDSFEASDMKTTFKPTLFLLKKSSLSALVWPPLTTKMEFSQGLQHSNYLCKYLTAKLLTCLLSRVTIFESTFLDSDMATTTVGLVESIRHMLPDVMTVISQIKWTAQVKDEQFTEDVAKFGQIIVLKYVHMRENITDTFLNLFLSLLLNYQNLFPISLLQANYDVSKLLFEHTTVPDQTLLQILKIINSSPPGAVKWFVSKIDHSPLIVLMSTYVLSKSASVRSEIEISLFRFAREMSHLCVNTELMAIVFSTLWSMLNFAMLLNIDKYPLEIVTRVVIALKSGDITKDKRSNQADGITFLIEVLERANECETNVCLFLEHFWTNIASSFEDEKTLLILFFFFTKLVINLGMKQDNLFKYHSTCFKFIHLSRDRIFKYPIACQIIYLRILDYLAHWSQPKTLDLNDLEDVKDLINANSILVQRIPISSFENSRISSLDEFIRICELETSDENFLHVLKFIPFGFANHFLKATNVYSSKFIHQLNFGEWLIQSSNVSNHLSDNATTYFTNFLQHIQPLVMLYFNSCEPEIINFENALDLSDFCHSMLKLSEIVNQDGMLALSNLTKFCGNVIIRASRRFNRMQNNLLINSLLKWLKHSQPNLNNHSTFELGENKAKRIKTSHLPDSIITSLLETVANVECDKAACVLELVHQLNMISQCSEESNIGQHSDYLQNIARDMSSDLSNVIATFIEQKREALFIKETTKYNNKINNNTVTLSRPEMEELTFLKSLYNNEIISTTVDLRSLSSAGINIDNALSSLLKSYRASLTLEDQSTLSALTALEASDTSTSHVLKPFVWGASVEMYLNQQMNTSTHIIQRHNPNEILTNLSSDRLNTTIANFPVTLNYNELSTLRACAPDEMYDPCFLLPLFSYILAPGVVVDCRKFAELGCLGVLFRCLSSLSSDIRASAAHCLERYTTHLGYNSFREKRQVSLLLDIIANTLTEEVPRIPSLHTSLLARSIQIMLRPHSEFYILLAKFFLSKPTLNTEELPLFNTMLLSSSPSQKQEKLWMIKLLTEGARSEDDYRFYKRRHVFPLLFSMCDLYSTDKQICLAVVKFAISVSYIPSAWNDLSHYEGIIAWAISLRAQIRSFPDCNEKKEIQECLDEIFSRRIR